jgi:phosphate starvation-inducible PhoH-like protein
MRGRTFNDAMVLLDEAQNATHEELLMFLTRIGQNCKLVVSGDVGQSDLPHYDRGGLKFCMDNMLHIPRIGIARLDAEDIVRNSIIAEIVKVFANEKTSRN